MSLPNHTLLLRWSEKFARAAGGTAIDSTPSRSGVGSELRAAIEARYPATTAASDSLGALWASALRGHPLPQQFSTTAGWLVPHLQVEGIETWQESELIGLHALSWIALGTPSLLPRLRSAALQCVAELQPDNVTGRPWGCHVFAWISVTDSDADASLYAQTLVHNALVARTEPEPLSAIILSDAAGWLTSLAGR